LKMSILREVTWKLSVVLICICFMAICTSSIENSLFAACAHFFWGCWFFGSWVFWVPRRFWILVPYQMNSWKRFSPILWTVS
jgi:hypothetical protein